MDIHGVSLLVVGVLALVLIALLGVAVTRARSRRRDVPLPTVEPIPAAGPAVALPEPPPVRDGAEGRERARSEAQAAAQRQASQALMTNLARRNQSLIGRQLATLDEMECSEGNPDVLSGLFELDHLATRMRRNAENLLVLAGAPTSGHGFAQPVPTDELLRGAAAEVEQFARVDVEAAGGSAVAGHVVSDLAHLLAELLDNALACSPPTTRVAIGAAGTPAGGLRLWVADEGIGMTAARLAEHNAVLADVVGDREVGATLGFPVVRRLAARHQLSVTLSAPDTGGLVADVEVPASVVVGLAPTPVELASAAAPTALPGRRSARRPAAALPGRSRRPEPARTTAARPATGTVFTPAPLPTQRGEDDGSRWPVASPPATDIVVPPRGDAPAPLARRIPRQSLAAAGAPGPAPSAPAASQGAPSVLLAYRAGLTRARGAVAEQPAESGPVESRSADPAPDTPQGESA